MKTRTMRAGDFTLIALVLLLAAAVAAPYVLAPSRALVCEVQQDGRVLRRIALSESSSETFRVEGAHGDNVITIDGRRVRISEAECPDQVCVQTGWLTRAGQAAVCLPNRIIVKLVGAQDSGGVDAVAQ